MKQFNLGSNEYYFTKERNEIVFHYRYEKKTLVGSKEAKINGEKLFDWLQEVLTPKYAVVECPDWYDVQLVESGETVTSFNKDMAVLSAKDEAYGLCARLNEEVG